MTISLFRSTKEPDLFGFTDDETGSSLPAEFGPWQKAGTGSAAASYATGSLVDLAASDPVMKAVKQEGFYLAHSGLKGVPRLYVLQSAKISELYAFTVDATGANLPIEEGPWERAGNAIPLGATMAATSPQIAEQVRRNGYALVKGKSISARLSQKDSTP
jgi:hypothetical protein